MSLPPSVSVIVAAYNRSQTLRLALDSLLGQQGVDFEAWVVGDACSDDSASVVAGYRDPRLNWLNLERHTGSQSGPNNAGLQLARGEYVAYLGHDDLWFPWHLAEALGAARASEADFVHSLCALIGPDGTRECVGPPPAALDYATFFVPPSCWLHRRQAVQRWGTWADADRIPGPVDLEFLRRLQRGGAVMRSQPRLGVLKFPSAWFPRAYAHQGAPCQARYHRALAADPVGLERQILQEAAARFGQAQLGGPHPWLAALWDRARVLWRTSGDALRWREPLRTLLTWKHQRYRRGVRRRRGLPPR